MGLEHNEIQLRAIRDVAVTPGVALVRLEWTGVEMVQMATDKRCAIYTPDLMDRLVFPTGASGYRMTAFGAFDPSCSTHTSQQLITELDRKRAAMGLGPLPGEVVARQLGFDELGHVTFEIGLLWQGDARLRAATHADQGIAA